MLLNNPLVVSPLIALIVAQASKVCIAILTEHRWAFGRMTETGGMPSAHAAIVSALCTSCLLYYGSNSPLFAISIVFGTIVIYDATGIRRAAGLHAEILNEFIEGFSHLFSGKARPKALKTLLGHSYPQVIVGLLIGIVTSLAAKRILSGAFSGY